jgi:hypothetical protein
MNAVANIHPVLSTPARVPVAVALFVLAPVVSFVCAVMMFGGIFAAIVFEVSAVGPRFPFLVVLGLSLGFGALFMLYQCLLALLVRD